LGRTISPSNSPSKPLRSRFPIELATGEEPLQHLFFPIAPAPQALRLEYYADQAVHEIEVDNSASMQGLDLENDS
jgi:hypothetical protein